MSDDSQDECHLSMLYDNMNISRLMVNFQQVEDTGVKRKSGMPKGKDILMVLQGVGLTLKKILSSIKGSLMKFLTSSLSNVMIGFQTLRLKREGVVVPQQISQHVEGLARNIIVIALKECIIVLVMVKMVTKYDISHILFEMPS